MDSPTSSSSSQSAAGVDEPVNAILQAVVEAAVEDPDFDGELASNQRRVIESKLLDPIKITFGEEAELVRRHNKLLPSEFFRTFYETSATLSSNVSVDMHTKHRDRKKLKIQDGVAFQPVAEFTIPGYLHREGIERQLVWNQKENPSGYISVFNAIGPAKRRAHFHHEHSKRIGQRVSISSISTKGLIPATVHARCESDVCIYTKQKYSQAVKKVKTIWRDVDVPVWIHKKARQQFGLTITPEQLKESGADMWVSITEIRKCNLKEEGPFGSIKRDSICAKGHDYEWLSCGPISQSRIINTWPWDGKLQRLHTTDQGAPIRSLENSGQPWIWDKFKKMWVPDWVCNSDATDQPQGVGKKRKHNDDDGDDEDEDDLQTAAILTGIIMAQLKRARRSSPEANSDSDVEPDSDAAPESDDEATPTPDSI